MRTFILSLVLCGCLLPSLKASHFMGANIRYECINACEYRVYHHTYYDCTGQLTPIPVNLPGNFPPPPNLVGFTITSSPPGQQGPSMTGVWVPVSYLEVTPICPSGINPPPGQLPLTGCNGTNPAPLINGVAEAIFYMDINFCNTAGGNFILEWDNCCRNFPITSGAANESIHVSTEMVVDITSCNNSPEFNFPPHAYFCNNLPTFIDVSATEADGDSLVYSLTHCSQDPNVPVTYLPGYSPIQPLGPNWGLSLDSQTGLLSVIPGAMPTLEVGVICVLVEEYRNGILLSETVRDLQVTVIDCSVFPNQNPQLSDVSMLSGASWTTILNDTLTVCPGDTLVAEFTFEDLDNDSVFLHVQASSLPNVSFSYSNNTPNTATGLLSWEPDPTQIGQSFPFFVLATDNHCPKPGQFAHIFWVKVQEMCLAADIVSAPCDDNLGQIDLTVWGGLPPYTYSWSNGATTEDLVSLNTGFYTVVVTDANGLTATGTFLVGGDDLLLTPTLNQPSCSNNDGSIVMNISSPAPVASILWNTGAMTDSIGGLPAGGYSVVVTDSFGCVNQWAGYLDPADSCFVSISGTVFDDQNGNCIQDAGEPGIPNLLVNLSPGPAVMTDLNGDYAVQLDTGTVTLNAVLGPYMNASCPGSASTVLNLLSYDDDADDIDFAIELLQVQDLAVFLNSGPAVPGFNHFQTATVKNQGSVPIGGTLTLTYDAAEAFVSTTPTATNVNTATQKVDWTFAPIPPGTSAVFGLETFVDSTIPLQTPLLLQANVLPINGDTIPSNNYDSLTVLVGGAYDPNDKQVQPAGIGEMGFILPTQNRMQYTVRFQNTGTLPAQYVVIRDTLDQDLDALSFTPVSSSHTYSLVIEGDSILVFSFDNIQLPDSASDPQGSQGYVSFLLEHDGKLVPGTQIHNSAAIYFDFNPPIITNTTQNTIFLYPKVEMANSDPLCEADDIVANMIEPGMPPYDFVWDNGTSGNADPSNSFTIPAEQTGWYHINVTDAFGFSTQDSVYLEVAPLPDASFSYTANGTDVQFQYQPQTNETWVWNFGNNQTSTDPAPNFLFPGSGVYTVELIVNNDCGADTSTQEVSIFATSLDDEFARSVRVMPNPFSETTQINYANPEGRAYSLYLYDQKGAIVRRYENVHREMIQIDREELAAGLYLFQLVGPHSFTGKLVIQ